MTDTARELALIFCPDPADRLEDEDDTAYQARLKAARAARAEAEIHFRSVEVDDDPLLDQLRQISATKRHLEELTRLVLAYARDFTRPEPYRLQALANATGMSVSGVRTAYGEQQKHAVADRIKRSDRDNTVHAPPSVTATADDYYVPTRYSQPGYRVSNWLLPPLSRPASWEADDRTPS
jgi:hypothetical protein